MVFWRSGTFWQDKTPSQWAIKLELHWLHTNMPLYMTQMPPHKQRCTWWYWPWVADTVTARNIHPVHGMPWQNNALLVYILYQQNRHNFQSSERTARMKYYTLLDASLSYSILCWAIVPRHWSSPGDIMTSKVQKHK